MSAKAQLIIEQVDELASRFVEGSGFRSTRGGSVRPDATAWAILALEAARSHQQLVDPLLVDDARKCLALAQLKDGRVCLARDHPEVYWPTSLVILAWQGAAQESLKNSQANALKFITKRDAVLTGRTQKDIITFDSTIKGWSWMEKTYSWVEPTALGVIAMRVAGHTKHRRLQDGVRLLIDRQIPGGGWNVGCPKVYDSILNPMPENTGMALQALAGLVPEKDVEASIQYLLSHTERLNTPFTLGWALLGLGAWGQHVDKKDELILNVWKKQGGLGQSDTTSISILLLAQLCENGLIDFMDRNLQWDKD